MGVISVLLQTAFQCICPAKICPSLPKTITAALNSFGLESRTITYAICPRCLCTYEPQSVLAITNYPKTCDNRPFPEAPICGTDLLQTTNDGGQKPIHIFLYHDFNDYLARLLARPDIEKVMDESVDNMAAKFGQGGENPIHDVLGAEFVKTFPDRSGKNLFIQRPESEGRYLFSLNVDFFNPERTTHRGATKSCGIITMACLNLPLEIRYKPENMYVAGIIPGPREPQLTDINHFLRPLIDQMVKSWNQGIRFSRTALFPNGRLTRCAIASVVCDLPAARKTAQMTSSNSHHYCSVCKCHHLKTIGRTDVENWERRDPDELRRYAGMWRDAISPADRKQIAAQHGVRWSELWRLEYWDPTRQLVVDSMHCLLQGLVEDLVRKILFLTTTSASEKIAVIPAFHHPFKQPGSEGSSTLDELELKQIDEIHEILTAPVTMPTDNEDNDAIIVDDSSVTELSITYASSTARETTSDHFRSLKNKLTRKRFKALEFVCQSECHGYPEMQGRRITKADIANTLVEWVWYHIHLHSYPLTHH
jgi:Transposase family tnp2.